MILALLLLAAPLKDEVSAAAAMPTAIAPAPTKLAAKTPSAGKDIPFTDKVENAVVLSDGAEHFVVFSDGGNRTGPLFAGDGKVVYEQRIVSSSRNGADAGLSFWDPRYLAGADRSFDRRAGKYSLTCGKKTVALVVSDKAVAELELRKPRWQRAPIALAVDDAGIYYYIDHTREPADDDEFRLFVGKRGHLELIHVDDTPPSAGARAFHTARGTLTIFADPPGAIWGSKRLTLLNLDTHAGFVYTKLGVYPGDKLATACDPYQ